MMPCEIQSTFMGVNGALFQNAIILKMMHSLLLLPLLETANTGNGDTQIYRSFAVSLPAMQRRQKKATTTGSKEV
jgi:hypothetical protein